MLNRRSFVTLGSLAAGASLASSCAPDTPQAAAAQPEPAAARTEPPSIAALASMRDQATPITADERRGRIDKARRLMAEHKIDALLLTGGTALVYFSGIRWGLSERLFAMILPVKGDAFYVSPAFEEDRAREQIARGPLGNSADVRTWEEHEDPYQRIAQGLKDRGISSGVLGIEETAAIRETDPFRTGAQGAKETT